MMKNLFSVKYLFFLLLLGAGVLFLVSLPSFVEKESNGEKESKERQAFQSENPQRYDQLLSVLLDAEEMILKDPQNEDAWVNKGWVHEEFGEYDLALGAYQKALDNNKASQIALINMASIYKRQGKYDAAESLYKIFIGFFPNSAQGYWNLAELYSTGKRGTVQDALGVLEQGVELTEDKGLQKELERLRAL